MDEPSPAPPLRDVTETERQAYQRDGVVLLENVYPPEWLAWLEMHLAALLSTDADSRERSADISGYLSSQDGSIGNLNQGSRNNMVDVFEEARAIDPNAEFAIEGGNAATPRGRSIVETDSATWHRGLRHHHLIGPMPEIVAQLTGSSRVNFYSDSAFLKEPGSQVKTPFHQDKPYFLVAGGDVAVCWVPVDIVTRETGAMGYVRGSHRWGKTFKPSDFVTETGTFPAMDGVDLSGLDTLPAITPETHDLVYFDTKPGDVIVHHWATIHGSGGNTSASQLRRAASIRYACDGCHYYRRPSSPVPFRKTIELADGDPLEKSPRFPIVWPTPS